MAPTRKNREYRRIDALARHMNSDAVTFAIALSAAITSSMFAGYMWTSKADKQIEGRLVFQELPTRTGNPGRTDIRPIEPIIGLPNNPINVDPITTASLRDVSETPLENQPESASVPSSGINHYNKNFVLLGIYADTALVTEAVSDSKKFWSVRIGNTIPSAGLVIAFGTDKGKPTLVTTSGIISSSEIQP